MSARTPSTVEEYTLEPPTLYESQLFPNGYDCSDDVKGGVTLDLKQANIVNYSGSKGSGKSTSLAYVGIKALAGGLKVYTNFPLQCYLIRDVTGNGKGRDLLKAELLNLKDFLTRKTPIKGGVVELDEYQDIASSYTFNSTKNRLLAATWAQIRKDDLSFYYGSKFYKWVDTRTRDELDLEFCCQDAHRTPWGRKKYKKGEMVFWQMRDWSGNLTGYQFEQYPIERPMKFFAKPIWGSFPTKFRIDIFDSMRGMQLDLEKDVISDKFEETDIDKDALAEAAQRLFDKIPRWNPADFWQELGIFAHKEKLAAKKILRDMIGFTEGDPRHPIYRLGTDLEAKRERELVPA